MITYNLTGNDDYVSGPYNVVFPAGASNTSFSVSIKDDNVTENPEAFLLSINPLSLSNVLIFGDHNEAVVTIVDNDCKFTILLLIVCSYHK